MSDGSVQDDLTEEQKSEHKAQCEKEADLCHETINKNQEEYDKQLLTLASGLLALVIAFVKDIVPLRDAIFLAFFYGTLIGGVLCILCVLFSYQLSINGHFKAKEFWEGKKPGEDYSKFPFHFASYVRKINILSGILFFLSIICLVTFIVINVAKERTVPDKVTSKSLFEGSNLKSPQQTPLPNDLNRGLNLKVPPQPPPVAPQTGHVGSTGAGTGAGQSEKK